MAKTFILIILILFPYQIQTPYSTAYEYLHLWQAGDYSAMYDMLSDQSKIYISRGEFIDKHQDFARKYIIDNFEVLEVINFGQIATIYYRLKLTHIGAGSETQDKRFHLIKEKDQWKIDY